MNRHLNNLPPGQLIARPPVQSQLPVTQAPADLATPVGAIFPVPGHMQFCIVGGLTKREAIAAQIVGHLANNRQFASGGEGVDVPRCAAVAVALADAVLEAAKTKEEK